MKLTINGRLQSVELEEPATLDKVLEKLGLKPDRIAVEHNGSIVARAIWHATLVAPNDKMEVVHFVGGGSSTKTIRSSASRQ